MDGRGRAPPGAVPYHELLATRVLSVDAYWAEQRDPRRRPPNEREIPVPLWPGESRQQYEREFRRWLQSRRLSLSLMQENPMTERNFRLEFAQTRVGRPQKVEWQEGERQTSPSERSRSRSRSPPARRRINGVQPPERAYPVKGEDNRGHSPSIDRRGPPGNGRPFATRQTGDQNGRSYSKERPFAAPAVPPSEASRSYDKRQQVQPPDPRSRQNSPRNVSHQHVGHVQHWNRSRSRSPQYYNKAPSPPQRVFATDSHRWNRSRSQNYNMTRSPPRGAQTWKRSRSPQYYSRASSLPSQVPPSAPSQHGENLHKQLLARRVISVEAFRDEMFKLRNGCIHEDDLKRPHETMVRIPIILWPGESMALYKQKFERWLDSRNVSLASLRDNPARERSLWHSFAYTRAGTSDFAEPGRPRAGLRSPPRARSRSRSRSPHRVQSRRLYERGRSPISGTSFNSRPVNKEYAPSTTHLRTPPSEPPQRSMSPSSTITPPEDGRLYSNKTRRQLLERRILSLDDFQKEVDLNIGSGYTTAAESNVLPAIPVPLYHGESMGLYDYRFWGWLKGFNESKESLRSSPARERMFRMKFAYLRANQPQVSGTTDEGGQNASSCRPNLDTHTKIPLDVLKSARARLAMNAKRLADDSEHRTGQAYERPDSKRARVNNEAGTQDHVMPVNTFTTTLAATSSQLTSTVSPLAPGTTKTLARPSMVEATLGSVGSVRSSIPSEANSGSLRVESRTLALIPLAQKRPATVIPNSATPQREEVAAAAFVQNTKSTATVISRSVTTMVGVSLPLRRLGQAVFASQSSTASQQKITTRPEQAARTPVGKPVETTASQSSTASQQKITPRPDPAPTTPMGKPVKATPQSSAASQQKLTSRPDPASRNSVVKPVDSQAASRSLMVIWKKRRPGSVAGTPLSGPVAKSAPPPSPALPAAGAPRNSSAEKPKDPPAPVAPVAGALHRSSPIASRPTTTTDTSNVNAVASTIENVAADTHSEPGTTPAETAADVGSNTGDESEEHDGDVMNPDGCCCTKCMRIWARTLTDRMDQLEQNVVDLKREVVTQTGNQSTTVISS